MGPLRGVLIVQRPLGKSGTVEWVAAEKGNDFWKGICFCVPARCWKNRYSQRRGVASEGDKKAYLTAGYEDQMR